MLFKICFFTVFLVYLIVLNNLVDCNNNYDALKTKNLSRLPRSNSKTNNEEFEKFFLKASKSVPRIGRRGSMNDFYTEAGNFNGPNKYQFLNTYPKRSMYKNLGAPFWADIAQIYEYNPDLPNILEYLSSLDHEQGDDPSVNDFSKMRYKKKNVPNYGSPNKEVMEYRLQAEV